MKYSMFIGRWQPWHKGHRWLIDQRLSEGKNVLICVREVSKDDKNPYDPIEVKKNVENALKELIDSKKVLDISNNAPGTIKFFFGFIYL